MTCGYFCRKFRKHLICANLQYYQNAYTNCLKLLETLCDQFSNMAKSYPTRYRTQQSLIRPGSRTWQSLIRPGSRTWQSINRSGSRTRQSLIRPGSRAWQSLIRLVLKHGKVSTNHFPNMAKYYPTNFRTWQSLIRPVICTDVQDCWIYNNKRKIFHGLFFLIHDAHLHLQNPRCLPYQYKNETQKNEQFLSS